MKRILLGLALIGAAAAPGHAQTGTTAPGTTTPGTTANPPSVTAPGSPGMRDSTTGTTAATPSVQTDRTRQNASAPVPGANSFTEGQARSRIEGAGYADVTGLQKDDQGIWRGRAMRGGQSQEVSLDYQGNVTGH